MTAKLRVKCNKCGKVVNTVPGNFTCPECKMQMDIPPQACVYLYRQGSFYGVAGGFGIYVNGEPYGFIGNKETLCIPLPFGTHTFHCAVGMSRRCRDLQITLTPENPQAYAKVYIKPGFWTNSFVIEPMDPAKLFNR